jgi:hypothetical protein
MHDRPTPHSPSDLARGGHCTRYERDGGHCRRPTPRTDGWCGVCAGFLRPHQQKPTTAAPRPVRPAHRPPTPTAEPLPLTSEEAYDPQIRITRSAIAQHRAKHGGGTSTAETEIRSLLENLISAGEHQRLENGTWRLQAAEGFSLLLSDDAARVISYNTSHRERTYAQVRASVPSRSRSREKAWVRELQANLPIRFTNLVLRRFAREVLGTDFTRWTGPEVVKAAHTHATQVQPDRPANDAGRRRVTDKNGLKWHFTYEPGERPVVDHLSWEPGRGSEAAHEATR